LFVLLLVLKLSIAVVVLVLEMTEYSYPAYWSAISRESLRSTIGIAAVQTAIEYEYRFTEYRPPRRTEYEYDEIRYETRTAMVTECDEGTLHKSKTPDRALRSNALFVRFLVLVLSLAVLVLVLEAI
jgi:hypothetical protein